MGPKPDHARRLLAVYDEGRSVAVELDALEQSMSELEATTRWLLVDHLLKDGHAATWEEAVKVARDAARLRELYPEAFA